MDPRDTYSCRPLKRCKLFENKVGGKVAASQFINNACDNFIPIFNLDENDSKPKMHFDYLFSADEEFFIGEFNAKALYVPGHTPADTAYYVEDIIFVGDTLFAPDVGTARCDFPGGSARKLFNSINRILSLPKETTMFLCHDYPDDRRNFQNKFTIQEQIEKNIHVKNGTREEDFILLKRLGIKIYYYRIFLYLLFRQMLVVNYLRKKVTALVTLKFH